MKNLQIINLLQEMLFVVYHKSIFLSLLFIIYINGICNISENLDFLLYANDTTFYTTHSDIDILFNRTNIELKKAL